VAFQRRKVLVETPSAVAATLMETNLLISQGLEKSK
jgi:hypothetical protein